MFAAGAADTFAAVTFKFDRVVALADQGLVEMVEHLEERKTGINIVHTIVDQLARIVGARLTPDTQLVGSSFHVCHYL